MLDVKRVMGAVITTAIFFYSICALMTILFPTQLLLFVNNWFHTVDLMEIFPEGKILVTPTNFLVGFFGVVLSSGAVSWFFALVYNNLKK